MLDQLREIALKVKSAVAAIPLEARAQPAGPGALGNPTSQIDRVAEDRVLREIEARELPINLLSEEAGWVDRGFPETLVLDPVDGTFNSYSGIPYYSVSMAVGEGSLSGIRAGLVMNLVTGECFSAESGKGAFLDGRPIHVREAGPDKLLVSYLGSSAVPHAYEVASRFRRVRCLGSAALDICLVASGAADAFMIEYSDPGKTLRIVDIAAAVLILREAGGEAWDANGQILDMPLSLQERRNVRAASHASLLEMME